MALLTTDGSAENAVQDDDIDATADVNGEGGSDSAATEKSSAPDELSNTDGGASPTRGDGRKSEKRDRRLSISVRSLALGAAVVGLIAALGVMTWLYFGAKNGLNEQTRGIDASRHAEDVALSYAVNAAVMDYKDLGPWKQNIVKGTTPELNEKLTKAANAMEQIVLPLQWTSTAKPLAAKTRSHDNGVYVVDAFVSVMTKTVQASDELQSTATYSVTVDSNNAWRITDVGGIAAAIDK
jgi:Mce-associated membrane protein